MSNDEALNDEALNDEALNDEAMSDGERWRITLAKDRRYDGAFVTGVRSTGMRCRPS